MLDLAAACDGTKKAKEALWRAHMDNKRKLITFVESRTGVKLDADKLLIGFSRRAAPYKRSNFIFTDRKFIEPLLKSGRLQIVFSGKAHPLDDNGKKIVENILEMTKKYPGPRA
jgi:starch phosphorylase